VGSLTSSPGCSLTNCPLTRGRAWASCFLDSYRIFFVKFRFCSSATQFHSICAVGTYFWF